MTNQPLVVVTDWGAAGWLPVGALLAATALGAFLYWRVSARRDPPALRTILFLAAGALFTAGWAPVLFSSDVYAYAAYGEMARIGLDPYAHAPPHSPDPLIGAAELQWVTAFPICLYGPGFVALARFVVGTLEPYGTLAQLDALRLGASVAFLLCIPLAYVAFPGDRAARRRAAATIGLNPAAIWCAVEGHNDALALLVVLFGFFLCHRPSTPLRMTGAALTAMTGAALTALSALIKPTGILSAIGLAIAQPRARIGALAGATLAVALSWPLIRGIATQLAPSGHYAPQASLQAVFAPLGAPAAWAAAGITCALLAARGIVVLRSTRDEGREATSAPEGWIWLGLAAWALIPNPYPWYGLWLVALAAIAPRSRAGIAASLLSLTAMLRYIPDAVATPNLPSSVALGVAAALPFLAVVRPGRRLTNHAS